MPAYYNEFDRFNCDWMSNLMDANLITPGKIDDRSIVDVRPDDVAGFERVHFFAGIGGWDYALNLAGWSGSVWTGSCPCQPFSLAGAQKGFDDSRHLWPEFKRLISKRSPSVVFGEQVASATEWLGLVRGNLEAMGYAVGAMPVQAASAGADHLRDRYWFVADTHHAGSQGRGLLPERTGERSAGTDGLADADGNQSNSGRGDASEVRSLQEAQCQPEHGAALSGGGGDECCDMADSSGERWHGREGTAGTAGRDRAEDGGLEWVIGADGKARRVKPGIRLLAHGIPNRVGLLRGFGNAIDPRPAAAFIGAYMSARSMSSHQLGSQGE